MSASQTPSPGRTPNGGAPPPFPRRKPADPLVRRKKPAPPRTAPQSSTHLTANGPSKASGTDKNQASSLDTASNQSTKTSSPAPQEEFEDIPLFTTKRALMEGTRYHIMRLLPTNSSDSKKIDPTDDSQFVRPVRLHRRDPRMNSSEMFPEHGAHSSDGESKSKAMDDKERERLEAVKAEKQAEREANKAQIAPTAQKKQEPKKENKHQKKTQMVYKFSDSVTKEKNQKIRYEEALPWHLEDFDNKNIWAGSYEAALSECQVILVQDQGGATLRMVPLEKWYKFTPKNHIKPMSVEEAESRMNRRVKGPKWLQTTEKDAQAQKERAGSGRGAMFTRQGERGERRNQDGDEDYERPEEAADMDDIDYNYEEDFADDEENALFEGDKEESKQAEEKLMRERREANVFELKEEKDYDEEEEEEKRRAEEEKKLAKKIEKALMKRERNFVYEDDSDRNPYASESESQDSDEEASNEGGGAKDEEGADAKDKAKGQSGEKPQSGVSSRGTDTPSRQPKDEDSKRGHLKRPVSPNHSDASGNESSRKKVKKSHGSLSTSNPSAAGATISRPSSPSNQTSTNGDIRQTSSLKVKHRAGSGSGSDGEQSDGAKKRRKNNSGLNSVSNSRAASPNGSRAASPAAGSAPPEGQSGTKSSSPPAAALQALPTPEEIRSKIPPEGVEVPGIMKMWGPRIVKNPQFITLLKAEARWAKEEKKFYPKAP